MNKGEKTKYFILSKAMGFASTHGVSKVTIGEISKLTSLSRTGVISHFKNKEDMQIAILEHIEKQFIKKVIEPSYDKNPLNYINNYVDNWLTWTKRIESDLEATCPLLKALMDFQNQPDSSVRQKAIMQQKMLLDHLAKLATKCVEQGYFKKDSKPQEFAYRVFSIYSGHYLSKHLFDQAFGNQMTKVVFDEILNSYTTS